MNEQRDLPFWHVCAVVVLFCVAYLVAGVLAQVMP